MRIAQLALGLCLLVTTKVFAAEETITDTFNNEEFLHVKSVVECLINGTEHLSRSGKRTDFHNECAKLLEPEVHEGIARTIMMKWTSIDGSLFPIGLDVTAEVPRASFQPYDIYALQHNGGPEGTTQRAVVTKLLSPYLNIIRQALGIAEGPVDSSQIADLRTRLGLLLEELRRNLEE